MGVVAAGLVIAAAGAGASMYAANKASKGSGQSRDAGQEISQMPVGTWTGQAAGAARDNFPLYEENMTNLMRWQPSVAGQAREDQMRSAKNLLEVYPSFGQQEQAMTRKQRQNDLKDLQRMGTGYADALKGMSSAYANLDSFAGGAGKETPLLHALNGQAMGQGPSAIRSKLQDMALSDLDYGQDLTPEEERQAQQAARSAFASRGLMMSNPAMVQEVLNRDSARRGRLDWRRNAAAQAFGVGQQEDALQHGFSTDVERLNQGNQQQRFQFQMGAADAQLRPILGFLGQRTPVSTNNVAAAMGLAPSLATTAGIYSSGPSINSGAAALNPLMGYSADVSNTNFNAAESRAQNSANMYAAVGSGLMSTGGAMAGGGMGGMGGGGGAAGGSSYASAGPVSGYSYNAKTGYSPV